MGRRGERATVLDDHGLHDLGALELLYDLVDEGHPDELPGVTYTEIDARDEFLAWIDDQTR
ncbi:hypothetical protein ACFQL4_00305 [Halosimplex aquaticum]